MRVLVACEFSGVVRDAFINRGHDAMSCDLLPTENPGPHYQGNVLDILDDGWDFMVAHPPCTYISAAGARWMYGGGVINNDRFKKMVDAVNFFKKLWNSKIPRKVIENPKPLRIAALPSHSQIVHPYYFGEPFSKQTRLWIRGVPLLKATHVLKEYEPYVQSGGKNAKISKIYGIDRSRTFPGIARAMAEQWG